MRILHILPSLNPVTGGPAKSIPAQLKLMASMGHHVEMYTTDWPDSTKESRQAEIDGVLVTIFPATPIWPLHHVPYSRALIAELERVTDRFDMFHVSSLWNPLATHALTILRRRRLPYAITCHGMLDPVVFKRNWLAKWGWAELWERRNVENANLIHFTSEQELAKAKTRGWRMRKAVVMPIPVDTSATYPPYTTIERAYPQLRGKEVIAFVGRLNWVKNLDLLVSAFAMVRRDRPDAALLLVGPDSDGMQAMLEQQAAKLGVSDSLIFTGLLGGEALKAAYARAQVVALVSRKENFGLAAAEALSAGAPVVLSDGVDMGKHWQAPPVWRVQQDPASIAQGLVSALCYAREVGLPAQAAFDLAKREWGEAQIFTLLDAFTDVVSERWSRVSDGDGRKSGFLRARS